MDNLSTQGFSDEELAYLRGEGEEPSLPSGASEPADEAETPVETAQTGDAEADADETDDADDGDEEGEQGDGRKKPRRVAYRQFVKERNAAKEAKEAAEKMRQELELSRRDQAVISERMRLFAEQQARQQAEIQQRQNAALAQQKAEANTLPPPPDRNEDPLAYMAWQDRRAAILEQQVNEVRQGFQSLTEAQRNAQMIQQFDEEYRSDGQMAGQQEPQFWAAYKHLSNVVRANIKAQAPRLSEAQLEAELHKQERILHLNAKRQGLRPAQVIWQSAVNTGWRPQAAQAAEAAAQQPAQPDPAAAQARIDAGARGQAQNVSLSGAGRPGNSTAGMTIEKFARLTDAEAFEFMEKNPQAFARLAGGA